MLKKLLVKIFLCIRNCYRHIKSTVDTFLLRQCNKKCDVTILLDGKIMILAPHSDDEWIGCSSIMQKGGALVVNMNMQGGDTDKLHQLRLEEMHKVAHACSCDLVSIGEDKKSDLKGVIKEFNPDYIFVPSYVDWHDEHYEVMSVLESLKEDINHDVKVVMYQASVPLPNKMINYCSQLDRKAFRHKWDMFNDSYKSQTFLPIYRFKKNERINGSLCDSYAAEVFSLRTYDQWLHEKSIYSLNNEEREECKSRLNNLMSIHMFVNNKVEGL